MQNTLNAQPVRVVSHTWESGYTSILVKHPHCVPHPKTNTEMCLQSAQKFHLNFILKTGQN